MTLNGGLWTLPSVMHFFFSSGSSCGSSPFFVFFLFVLQFSPLPRCYVQDIRMTPCCHGCSHQGWELRCRSPSLPGQLEGASLGQGSSYPRHLGQGGALEPIIGTQPARSFTYCLWLLFMTVAMAVVESGWQRLRGLQRLTYLLSGLLQGKFADPWPESEQVFGKCWVN